MTRATVILRALSRVKGDFKVLHLRHLEYDHDVEDDDEKEGDGFVDHDNAFLQDEVVEDQSS